MPTTTATRWMPTDTPINADDRVGWRFYAKKGNSAAWQVADPAAEWTARGGSPTRRLLG